VVIDNMLETQGHPAGSRPIVVTLYEHECKRGGKFRPENPWLQLSDTRGAGEGTYQWHKDPREPNLSLPRDWVWCSSWGAHDWEYYARDGWTGITLFTDAPTSNCTSRRMPWQRTAAYRPNLVLSPIIKGKELMAGMPNIDDADVDLEQPPCALESEPDPRPLGIAPIARITSSEQLSGMTAYGTVSCEDSECGVSPSQHSPSEESLPAEESWTCQVCTYEHIGPDSEFLACAMCHNLRRTGEFDEVSPELRDEPESAGAFELAVQAQPSMPMATKPPSRQEKRSWTGFDLRHQLFGMGMAGR